MIYDTFSFFNELDLLELRLHTLSEVVDRFVLVEATRTHSGKQKPLVFEENKERFSTFLPRIEHIVVEEYPPFETAWTYENYQRNCVAKGLSDAKPDDWVLTSDLDEIPAPAKVRVCSANPGRYRFDQTMYGYWMNVRCLTIPHWYGTRMVSVSDFLHGLDHVDFPFDDHVLRAVNIGTTATKWRFVEDVGWRTVRNGGWHFTSLGGAEAVARKAAAFAHTEFNTEENRNPESIAKRLSMGVGPLDHPRLAVRSVRSTLPVYALEHPERYGKFLLHVSWSRRMKDSAKSAFYLGLSATIEHIRPLLPRWIRPFMIRLRGWAKV